MTNSERALLVLTARLLLKRENKAAEPITLHEIAELDRLITRVDDLPRPALLCKTCGHARHYHTHDGCDHPGATDCNCEEYVPMDDT